MIIYSFSLALEPMLVYYCFRYNFNYDIILMFIKNTPTKDVFI